MLSRQPFKTEHKRLWLATICLIMITASVLAGCGDSTPVKKARHSIDDKQQSGCQMVKPEQAQTLYVGDGSFTEDPKTVRISALDVKNGAKLWQQTIAQAPIVNFEALQRADGVIYATHATNNGQMGSSAVTALTEKDGHVLWQYKAEPQTQINDMNICSGIILLYLSNTNTNTQSIEAHSTSGAHLLWSYTNNGYIGKPVVTSNAVYTVTATIPDMQKCNNRAQDKACSTISTIHALQLTSGKELWHSKQYTTSFGFVTLTATEQAVYAVYPIGSTQSSQGQQTVQITNAVDALYARDGTLVWHMQTGVKEATEQISTINGVLYLAGKGLAALNASDGKQRWFNADLGGNSLQITTQGLYAIKTQATNNFCTISLTTGQEQWCTTTPGSGSIITASASTIYTSANFAGSIHALQKDAGKELWQYQATTDHHIFGLALN